SEPNDPPAHTLAKFLVNEPICDTPLPAHSQRHPAPVSPPRSRLALHANGPVENAAANPRGLRAALEDIAVKLLEKSWHGCANVGPHLQQRLRDIFHARNVSDGHA